MRVRFIVISLARRADRLAAFVQRFKLSAPPTVPVARFEAVDGRALRQGPFLDRLFRENDFQFKAGVMGCALSHLELWHQLLKDRDCDAFVVFEDDVLFADNFWQGFERLLQSAPREAGGALACDFLFLGGMEPEAQINQSVAVAKPNAGHGTFGYIVTRAGARNAIAIAAAEGIRSGADWFLIRHFGAIRALTAWPELCAGLIEADSDIQNCEIKPPQSGGGGKSAPAGGTTKLHLRCNWCSPDELRESWNRMTEGNFRWGSLEIVPEREPADVEVIVNSCEFKFIGPRAILLQMEPAAGRGDWGFWKEPDPRMFEKIFAHGSELNTIEWHLSLNREALLSGEIQKTKVLSTVTSGAYQLEGHKKRLDFIGFMEQRGVQFDLFGRDNPLQIRSYRGPLPPYRKDDGLLPYRYTFAAENCAENGYATEKIWDGILAECLTFYWGCPNLEDFIDPLSFVRLDLNDFEGSLKIVADALAGDLYSARLPHIRAAKRKILHELSIFARIEKALAG